MAVPTNPVLRRLPLPSGFGQFPLFPDTHPYPAVQPSIQAFDVFLHVRYPIVVQPSSHVDFYLFHGSDDTPAPAPGSKPAQFLLGFCVYNCVCSVYNSGVRRGSESTDFVRGCFM